MSAVFQQQQRGGPNDNDKAMHRPSIRPHQQISSTDKSR
eukprot:COSAG02_NODE_50544_length_320_cov_0.407240_1_plen_38_part_10